MKRNILAFVFVLAILSYGCTQNESNQGQMVREADVVQEETGSDVIVASEDTIPIISEEELAMHNSEGDCWIVYEGQVFDFSGADMHPNMAKAFFSHCGQIDGFEEAAKARHSASNVGRVENFGKLIGRLE